MRQATGIGGHGPSSRLARRKAVVQHPHIETLVCIECDATSANRATGWEAHLIDLDDDGLDEVVLYCPTCAWREFGSDDR